MRIGIGYDVHKLITGPKLVLGGETIAFSKGLLGHSDADVLVHALCDAILGAAGLGDIGQHFPDTDDRFKDMDSMVFLKKTCEMIKRKKMAIVNVDSTVFAEAPKLDSYRSAMTQNLAEALEINAQRINIKATTTEGLGYIGRGEGIGAVCVVLLDEN